MRLNSCCLVFMAFRLDPFPRDPGQQLSMETAVAERLSAAAINFFVLLLHGCTSLRPACAWRGDWQACERVLRGARGQSCCPSGGCMRSCSACGGEKRFIRKLFYHTFIPDPQHATSAGWRRPRLGRRPEAASMATMLPPYPHGPKCRLQPQIDGYNCRYTAVGEEREPWRGSCWPSPASS